jgi:hypothetical protein
MDSSDTHADSETPPHRTEADVLRHLERLQHQLTRVSREIREYVEANEKRHPHGGE